MAEHSEIEHGSEGTRHMNRSSIGIGIGVVLAVIFIGIKNVPILLLGCVLGAVGGSFIGASMDIRGGACSILKSLAAKLDPIEQKEDKQDESKN